MLHDLKATYWWYEIKRDVAEYVAVCVTCQRVETEHQRRARMFQLLQIPKSKQEEIAIDFVMGLPWTESEYDSLWTIVDRLAKVAHFIPVNTTYIRPQLAELYSSRIVCLHEVTKWIVTARRT
jgi:hypothetical protein